MTDQEKTKSVDLLVQSFRTNIKELKQESGALEATVRQEYIDPFWRALGWDVGNREGKSAGEKDVVIERSLTGMTGRTGVSRRPDYIFRVDSFPRFIVEAKRPAIDLRTDTDSIFQAKTYAWSAQIPFAILTDFEQFRLFDTCPS